LTDFLSKHQVSAIVMTLHVSPSICGCHDFLYIRIAGWRFCQLLDWG